MFIIYIKQAWKLLKEEKLFSAFYIIGTGVAIALTMIVSIFLRLQFANTYPEKHRSDILTIQRGKMTHKEQGSMMSSSIGIPLVEQWLYPIEEAYTTAVNDKTENVTAVQSNNTIIPAAVKYTDENFFKVFDFDFIVGEAFTEDARINKLEQAVITENFAKQLFGSSKNAIGKKMQLEQFTPTVIGVVKDAPSLASASFASVYLPYSINEVITQTYGREFLGTFQCYIRAKNHRDIPVIIQKINEKAEQFNQNSSDGFVFELNDQPDPYWRSFFRLSDKTPDMKMIVLIIVVLFFILLGIPALNLNGMIASRMENLLPELGIRKTFGARKSDLLIQLFWENLVLTCFGGLFGLMLTWIILLVGNNFVFHLLAPRFWNNSSSSYSISEMYNWDMLFSPSVFLIAFLFCCLMNLLSSLIPAIKALRKDIIYSLNIKK